MQASLAQRSSAGWGNGLLGVIIFSGSLPATRTAVAGFDPFFLTSIRAVIAALLGIALLSVLRQPFPKRQDIMSLAVVALGVVIGFPLLSALALAQMTAAQSLVLMGILPFSTAIFAVLRGGERPKPFFWVFSGVGSLAVAAFALSQDAEGSLLGSIYMFGAIIVCGLGYAEGATLSRKLGGWQVISWALALALPVMLIAAILSVPAQLPDSQSTAWYGLMYVSVFSMLVGVCVLVPRAGIRRRCRCWPAHALATVLRPHARGAAASGDDLFNDDCSDSCCGWVCCRCQTICVNERREQADIKLSALTW